jgi:hypothetical protein
VAVLLEVKVVTQTYNLQPQGASTSRGCVEKINLQSSPKFLLLVPSMSTHSKRNSSSYLSGQGSAAEQENFRIPPQRDGHQLMRDGQGAGVREITTQRKLARPGRSRLLAFS